MTARRLWLLGLIALAALGGLGTQHSRAAGRSPSAAAPGTRVRSCVATKLAKARLAHPWLDTHHHPPVVNGSVRWPNRAAFAVDRGEVHFTSNGLPPGPTGSFPVAPGDPARRFLPAVGIGPQRIAGDFAASPKLQRLATCVPFGQPVGITTGGVPIMPDYQIGGVDAMQLTVRDRCGGTVDPDGLYSLIRPVCEEHGQSRSVLIGYARDGLPIVVSHDRSGRLPLDRSLDRCHGRVGSVFFHGRVRRMYHYELTQQPPYVLACFRAKPSRDWRIAPVSAAAARVPPAPGTTPPLGPPPVSPPAAPVNRRSPSISGMPDPQARLTASSGEWSAPTEITFAYQWQLCDGSGAECQDIPGATSPSYTTPSDNADAGDTYRVRVSASDAGGVTPATSGPSVVVPTPDPPGLSPPASGVQASPSLYPAYDPSISDYVTRCDGTNPIQLGVHLDPGQTGRVDGHVLHTSSFGSAAMLTGGQAFSFTIADSSSARTYNVRCLPSDFPHWTFTRNAMPSQQWYLIVPSETSAGKQYVVMFDTNGVPVWWYHEPSSSHVDDAKLMPDGNLAWWMGDAGPSRYEEHRFDGSLTRTVVAVGNPLDHHDMQELPNGDYVVILYVPEDHTTDLTSVGGPSNARIVDGEIQEISPTGRLVWSWSTQGHVAPSESARWMPDLNSNPGYYDIVHMNSVEPVAGGFIVSLRHTDGVYRIDKASGNILWKLGGTQTAQSLTVLNDPYASNPTGGQHDARLLADGTLTLHANGTNLNRAPRAVHYAIDTTHMTATLLDSVSDPSSAPSSACCGSARRLANGGWVTDWGDTPVSEEFAPDGSVVDKLVWTDPLFSYRTIPIAPGRIGVTQLRAGMNSMYPRR